jgi:hypothetical protein
MSAAGDVDACEEVWQVVGCGMTHLAWPTEKTVRTEANEFIIYTPEGRALAITVEDVTA